MKKTIIDIKLRIWIGLALTFVGISAPAGPYSIAWSGVGGGGGTATGGGGFGGPGSGGTFSLSATIAQPAAGPSAGGACSLTAGFWAPEVIVTPGAPRLTLLRSGSNAVLSWPSAASGYVLQSNTNLALKTGWTNVSQAQVLSGNQYSVTVPATQPKQFFRLVHP